MLFERSIICLLMTIPVEQILWNFFLRIVHPFVFQENWIKIYILILKREIGVSVGVI